MMFNSINLVLNQSQMICHYLFFDCFYLFVLLDILLYHTIEIKYNIQY